MNDATDPQPLWAQPNPPPAGQVETVDDRLRRLEQALAAAQTQGSFTPNGLAALDTAGVAGLVPAAFAAVGFPAGGMRFALFREPRLMFHMYFDPRYRLSRIAQLGAPIILTLIVLNYFFVGGMPFIGGLVERVFLVVLSVALYKLLSHEAARYEAVLNYLARYAGRPHA